MFDRFYNRIGLRSKLVTVTPLYIGAGEREFKPAAIRGPLLRDGNGQPYIPGSSIKGVLRSFLESVNDEACYRGEKCHKPFEKKEGRDKLRSQVSEWCKKEGRENEVERVFAQYLWMHACRACRLFGSNVLAGKVKFADAVLIDKASIMKTEIRTGNAIDRDTHTVASSAFFDTEAIPVGTTFAFNIFAENLTRCEAVDLANLLQYFAEGNLLLGGRSRSGLGQVKLEEVEIDVIERENSTGFPKKRTLPDVPADSLAGAMTKALHDSFAPDPDAMTEEGGESSCWLKS